jgi:hypothetical protein
MVRRRREIASRTRSATRHLLSPLRPAILGGTRRAARVEPPSKRPEWRREAPSRLSRFLRWCPVEAGKRRRAALGRIPHVRARGGDCPRGSAGSSKLLRPSRPSSHLASGVQPKAFSLHPSPRSAAARAPGQALHTPPGLPGACAADLAPLVAAPRFTRQPTFAVARTRDVLRCAPPHGPDTGPLSAADRAPSSRA